MDPGYEQTLLSVEDRHYWFLGRRRLLGAVIARLPLREDALILDVGCGGGSFLLELARFGTVTAVEPSSASFAVARGRGIAEVIQAPVENLDLHDRHFDLVTCLDVIEHVDDDVAGFAAMYDCSRPGAHLVVTVPAYPRLWSDHDVVNHHRRRYVRGTLVAAAEHAGWQLLRSTYFNMLLLPPAAVYKVLERLGVRGLQPASRAVLTTPPRPLNQLLELPLRIEARLIAAGVGLPAGLSLLAVFRHPG